MEEYEVNKLKNEDGYSCFHAFVQLPGHSSKTERRLCCCVRKSVTIVWRSLIKCNMETRASRSRKVLRNQGNVEIHMIVG